MEALHPLPSGLVSMRYPLYSKASAIVDGPFLGVRGRVEDGRSCWGHAASLLWLRIPSYAAIGIWNSPRHRDQSTVESKPGSSKDNPAEAGPSFGRNAPSKERQLT